MKKLKKHTLRAERNMVCALCAIVFLVFAGAAIAGWIAAPFPVGAVLTGVAAFVLLFTGILSGSWIKYAKRFYAAAVSPDYPCAIIGEGLTVTFCAVSPEKAAAYLREGAALPRISGRARSGMRRLFPTPPFALPTLRRCKTKNAFFCARRMRKTAPFSTIAGYLPHNLRSSRTSERKSPHYAIVILTSPVSGQKTER